ncbi:MAG: hypothetical protein ACK6BG_12475 [Cyanobacteriota bacterium]
MPSRTGRGRRGSSPDASPRLLHHLQALLTLATRSERITRPREATSLSRAERRRQQHLALGQRLLDPLPRGLRAADRGADRFWSALRWGGCGLLVARLLAQ